jgi:hypothetical protein
MKPGKSLPVPFPTFVEFPSIEKIRRTLFKSCRRRLGLVHLRQTLVRRCLGHHKLVRPDFKSGHQHSFAEGEFTEGHELPGKWKVAKQMVGRRLSQEEAKKLLAKFKHHAASC